MQKPMSPEEKHEKESFEWGFSQFLVRGIWDQVNGAIFDLARDAYIEGFRMGKRSPYPLAEHDFPFLLDQLKPK